MSRLRPIAKDTFHTQPWANGAGTTTVIATGPNESNWQWRLSIADITQGGDFSAYPDTRRQFVTLDAPVQLRFVERGEISLLRLSTIAFDGEDAPHAVLPDGATRAFNLMLRGDEQGELIARPLNGSMWLPTRTDYRWYLHMLAGQGELQVGDQRTAIEQGSHWWIEAQPGERARLEGGGELVLVQLAMPLH